tara:strand:- start:537 stop:1478 length:942 start_codon:yes stop_codon:yes gene_type:complete
MMMLRYNFLIMSTLMMFLSPSLFSQVFNYDGSQPTVGSVEYAVVDETINDLHDLSRQYNTGYDALLGANPHLNEETDLEPGMVVIIPNKIILPKRLKPNTVYINLPEKRVFFFDQDEQKLYVFPVGVGRLDHPSPTGKMTITLKRYKPIWNVPKGVLEEAHANGYTDHPRKMPAGPDNPLGDYAVHLSAHTYLIHATHNPDLIGTRNTSGCINLYPEHLAILYEKIKVKTPVEIINMPTKIVVIDDRILVERYPTLFETTAQQNAADEQQRFDHDMQKAKQVAESHNLTLNQEEVDKLNAVMHNYLGYPITAN